MTRSERCPVPSAPAADPGSLRVSGRQGWDQHPGVRTGRRLRRGEQATDLVCRIAGSWIYLIAVIVTVLVGVAAAQQHGSLAGGLAGLALVEVSLILVAARRAERIAMELALYNLDQARRTAAIAEELRGEMQRLHADIARIAAYTEKAGYPARHP